MEIEYENITAAILDMYQTDRILEEMKNYEPSEADLIRVRELIAIAESRD